MDEKENIDKIVNIFYGVLKRNKYDKKTTEQYEKVKQIKEKRDSQHTRIIHQKFKITIYII